MHTQALRKTNFKSLPNVLNNLSKWQKRQIIAVSNNGSNLQYMSNLQIRDAFQMNTIKMYISVYLYDAKYYSKAQGTIKAHVVWLSLQL